MRSQVKNICSVTFIEQHQLTAMNIKKIYNDLIARAIDKYGHPKTLRSLRKVFAKHHIQPASLFEGGRRNPAANISANLVWLTYREHFVAHWLLARIHGGRLSYAFAFMCQIEGRACGRVYERHLLAGIEWKQNDPAYRLTMTKAAKRRFSDPEYVAAHRARMAVMHSDPEFQAKRLAAMRNEAKTPKARARYKAEGKRRAADPEFAKAHALAMRSRAANPANREIEKMRGQHNKINPVWRENQREGARRFRENNPEWVEANRDFLRIMAASSEHRKKLSASRRALHADPVFKAKHLARMRARHNDPAFREKRLSAIKKACASPEWQANQSQKVYLA